MLPFKSLPTFSPNKSVFPPTASKKPRPFPGYQELSPMSNWTIYVAIMAGGPMGIVVQIWEVGVGRVSFCSPEACLYLFVF